MPKYINEETAEASLRQYAEQKHANGELELANGILKGVCKLNTIPAADVKEVVRGKWVEVKGQEFVFDECTVCGKRIAQYTKNETNFCPSCGADMREAE